MKATRDPASPPGAAPSSIVVRTPNWLGDLLMSTAFLQAVLARFPDATLDIIVRKGFEVLPLPRRGRIIPYDKHARTPGAFGRELRESGYSHFFVLPPSLSSAWMAFRSGVPRRIGYGGGGRGWLLNSALPYRNAHRSVHLTAEYLDLLGPWAVDYTAVDNAKGSKDGAGNAGMDNAGGSEAAPYAPKLEADEAWIARHLPAVLQAPAPYVALAPGAEFGPAKQWPIAHYARLASALGRENLRVVVMGLAKDREAGEQILADCANGLNLCGETSLPAGVALVARAALLVSNDSGAMHIGAALRRPQIALFGSSNPSWTAPLNPNAVVEHLNLDCGPCYKRNCPLGHTDCLGQITPEAVLEHALGLLQLPARS